jgi:hypothetical protein
VTVWVDEDEDDSNTVSSHVPTNPKVVYNTSNSNISPVIPPPISGLPITHNPFSSGHSSNSCVPSPFTFGTIEPIVPIFNFGAEPVVNPSRNTAKPYLHYIPDITTDKNTNTVTGTGARVYKKAVVNNLSNVEANRAENERREENININKMATKAQIELDKLKKINSSSKIKCYYEYVRSLLEEWEEAVGKSKSITKVEKEKNYKMLEELEYKLTKMEIQKVEMFKAISLSAWGDRKFRQSLDKASRLVLHKWIDLKLHQWSSFADAVLDDEEYYESEIDFGRLFYELEKEEAEVADVEINKPVEGTVGYSGSVGMQECADTKDETTDESDQECNDDTHTSNNEAVSTSSICKNMELVDHSDTDGEESDKEIKSELREVLTYRDKRFSKRKKDKAKRKERMKQNCPETMRARPPPHRDKKLGKDRKDQSPLTNSKAHSVLPVVFTCIPPVVLAATVKAGKRSGRIHTKRKPLVVNDMSVIFTEPVIYHRLDDLYFADVLPSEIECLLFLPTVRTTQDFAAHAG